MIYYKELAHVMMEAEKSHSWPPASWQPKKADGVGGNWRAVGISTS